jgi:hypothetical protein
MRAARGVGRDKPRAGGYDSALTLIAAGDPL